MRLVLIRGGGDLGSGVAIRLHRAGFGVVITELAQPLAVRRAGLDVAIRHIGDCAEARPRWIVHNLSRRWRKLWTALNLGDTAKKRRGLEALSNEDYYVKDEKLS